MHPNIKLTVKPPADTVEGTIIDESLDLTPPPPSSAYLASWIESTSESTSHNDFISGDSLVAYGADMGPTSAKRGPPRRPIARVPSLSEIIENGSHKPHQRVFIIPSNDGGTETEHRLMMLLVSAIEKILFGVEHDELLAVASFLDESWGGTQIPGGNVYAADIRGVVFRRGYEITKAVVEGGILFLSVYKKEFSGFMKMAIPEEESAGLPLLPQQTHRGSSRLRPSVTIGDLRARARGSPTPLYPALPRVLHQSSSTIDIRGLGNSMRKPLIPIQPRSTSIPGQAYAKPPSLQTDGHSVRSKSSRPHLRSTTSHHNLLTVSGVAHPGRKSTVKSRRPASVISLRPGTPRTVEQHRNEALDATLAFGKALLVEIEKDNGGYIERQTAGIAAGSVVIPVTQGNMEYAAGSKSGDGTRASGTQGPAKVARRHHERVSSESKALGSIGGRRPGAFTPTGSTPGNDAGGKCTRAATVMGLKNKDFMISLGSGQPKKVYGRNIKWN